MNPTLQQVISFLDDEGLSSSIKVKEGDDPFWSVQINDPWTADSKLRCKIALTNVEWSDEPQVLFNTYKSSLLYGNEYKGIWWKFVQMIKAFDSLNEAKIFFMANYMLHGNLKNIFTNTKQVVSTLKPKIKVKFPEEFIPLDVNKHTQYTKYLLDRKLSIWRIKELGLFVDLKEKRVIFPIYENSDLVFWTGRSIYKSNLPWKNATCTSWPHPIWNLDNIKAESSVYIFEAIFDAAMMYNGIAILGASNIQEEQINKIINKKFSRIVVIMDNDEPGEQTRIELAKRLSEYHSNVWIYNFKNIVEKDFNEMAQHGIEFDIDNRIQKFGLKAQLAKKLKVIK